MKTQHMKTIKHILYLLLGFLFIYLVGSFYSISFDIAVWSQDTRLIMSIISGFFVVLCVIIKNTSSLIKTSILDGPDSEEFLDYIVRNSRYSKEKIEFKTLIIAIIRQLEALKEKN